MTVDAEGWEENVLNVFLIALSIGVVILVGLIVVDAINKHLRSKALKQARVVSARRHALYRELVLFDTTAEELRETLAQLGNYLDPYKDRMNDLSPDEEEHLDDLMWVIERVTRQYRDAEVARHRASPGNKLRPIHPDGHHRTPE